MGAGLLTAAASLRPVSGSARDVLDLLRPWVAGDDVEPLVVRTSGSTGEPKDVRLSRGAVLASAHATHARLGGPGQWLLALPVTGVGGLQVLVRSLLAEQEPVLLDDHDDLVDALRELDAPRTYASLVPTQLHRLASAGRLDVLAALDAVLVGGAALDPTLREQATSAGVRVVRTYGMSETSGGCVYDGVPLDGVAVALGPSGRIRLAGPTIFDGYDGDPGLTAEVLVDGWFHTADAGRLDEDGRLQVLGRVDDVVVTGGVNVPGPAVAARLREHPDLAAAEVLGVPDEEWGRRLVAFVVPRDGAAPSTQELRDWVAAERPRSWAPRQVVEVRDIPLLANGKPDRLALGRLVGEPA
ncbi:AMP-binding protein [uncultured Aeromicrobium sp.]|uniref:AMP-binding protein n=1 Tax=uncultured Aeromicrobium sp. TaxID=337820 RepID=UPI002593C9F4|nr:AMP-binding protein [uncultured Aeromicrobium sp.]